MNTSNRSKTRNATEDDKQIKNGVKSTFDP